MHYCYYTGNFIHQTLDTANTNPNSHPEFNTSSSYETLASATYSDPRNKLTGLPSGTPSPVPLIHQDEPFRGRGYRRHSMSSGTLRSSAPPRHALHVPVMKLNPEIWRNERHQREIHRLMHDAREVEVMRRRNMKSIMDTSEEGDEENEMTDVTSTIDLGGFKALEEREKVK
ncbi:hypothetical protein BGZ49_006794 [Haplosporangium sp. Z 27]|nr:hypothetical protein BGZ49_006794 [Haplosporangium sp. Z 27]